MHHPAGLARPPREPWRSVVADLVRTEPGQAAVIWVDELAVPVFDYYLRQEPAAASSIRWAPLFGHRLPQLPELKPQAGHTFWILTAESAYRRLIALLPATFQRHYQLLEQRHELGIGLYRFQPRASPAPGRPEVPEPDRVAEWGLLLPSDLDTCQPKQFQ